MAQSVIAYAIVAAAGLWVMRNAMRDAAARLKPVRVKAKTAACRNQNCGCG